METLLTSGSSYFPGWVSILFSVGLGLGVIHHLQCLVLGHGNRWFHGGHAAMALSMIYMFLSMSYDWTWLPAAWQMWFFATTSAAVVTYLLGNAVRGRPFNFLWILLLIQQAAMIYMWYPMMRWNATVIFVLVAWFAIKAFGWCTNLFPDDIRERENRKWFPQQVGAPPVAAAAIHATQPVEVGADGPMRTLVQNGVSDGAAAPDCHTSRHLITSDWKGRALMAIMALSMSYMFYGMELMR